MSDESWKFFRYTEDIIYIFESISENMCILLMQRRYLIPICSSLQYNVFL